MSPFVQVVFRDMHLSKVHSKTFGGTAVVGDGQDTSSSSLQRAEHIALGGKMLLLTCDLSRTKSRIQMQREVLKYSKEMLSIISYVMIAMKNWTEVYKQYSGIYYPGGIATYEGSGSRSTEPYGIICGVVWAICKLEDVHQDGVAVFYMSLD